MKKLLPVIILVLMAGNALGVDRYYGRRLRRPEYADCPG